MTPDPYDSITLETCEFSIIYSCDVPARIDLLGPPPAQSHRWDCTERSGGSEGAQMEWGFDRDSDSGRQWARGRHRKYCALLNWLQFEAFLDHTGLCPESCETMGSLGAPGFGFGWAPAISFWGDDPDRIQSAYVTPVPTSPPDTDTPALPGLEDAAKDAEQSRQAALWRRLKADLLDLHA